MNYPAGFHLQGLRRAERKGNKQTDTLLFLVETYIFHFEFFACCPFLQLGGALANEIKHDHSPEVIDVQTPDTIYHTKPCILIPTV